MSTTQDWIIYSLRILAFCIGFFIIMDYIFTCNIETKKGHMIMIIAMVITLSGFVIYRWSDIFGKNKSINPDISTSINTINMY